IHIIPELLPTKRPAISFERYDTTGNLRFRYRYDFMPDGIIGRFISRVHYLVKKESFWKNGVELTFGNATALVLSDPLNREMTIAVHGTDKSELLAIIRNELDHIHRTLNMESNEHYKEMIPCICSQCSGSDKPFLFDYEVLKRRLDKGKRFKDCDASDEEVSIERLIKGVEREKPIKELDLLEALEEASYYLQGIAKSIDHLEDSRNDFITTLLSSKGLIAKDQTRWGISETGKSIGRLDFKVFNPESGEEAVVEAFNLKSLDRKVIDGHLKKLFHYDATGLPRNFILVYCEAKNFIGLWEKYLDHIPTIDFDYPLAKLIQVQKSDHINLRLARAVHKREKQRTEVYHLFIKMS
ncbi:MAG: hypothetical protein GY940_47125, partial [bacterium]|nr:hypothetical protein [bacterium]